MNTGLILSNTVAAAAAVCISQLFATAADAQSRDKYADTPRMPAANSTPSTLSINGFDDRVMVPLGGERAELFDAIGILNGGTQYCTATFVVFQGYSFEDPLLLTGRHCVEGIPRNQMSFETVTVNMNGQLTHFTSRIDSVYFSSDPNDNDGIAILTMRTQPPPSIRPAIAVLDGDFNSVSTVSVAGYASDIREQGLVAHVNCRLIGSNDDLSTSFCDVASGMSGAPVISGISGGQLFIRGIIRGTMRDIQRNVVFTTMSVITTRALSATGFLGP